MNFYNRFGNFFSFFGDGEKERRNFCLFFSSTFCCCAVVVVHLEMVCENVAEILHSPWGMEQSERVFENLIEVL